MSSAEESVFASLRAYADVVDAGRDAAKAAQAKQEADNWNLVVVNLGNILEREGNAHPPASRLLLDVDKLTKEQRAAMLALVQKHIADRGTATLKTLGFRDSREPPRVHIEMVFASE
jgi:hypothetical protein